ncbi:hypothetical protein QAZ01_02640 [Glaesserella parasuis]|uniref:baseplate complex protein n=1 Tax=Glaesserella parasuis TaxID=738 RepID=UPI0021BDE871|nr:hypothetical protein [Glaesserella parasuis]MCT8830308.1 hypothetical protein [Glaesserella parasuis]MCT8835256.1 hypothetical protein [Glaesserella parasuis]MDG6449859.1 hypothetical protein [Glaesserella parasuis]MDO9791716.1 hypothetical protein [Glaesserella parasuis]MDP0348272.1 hypothetical protein [Glaesserella parasuis]
MILPADKKPSLINTARPKPAVQLALDGKPIYLHNFLATVKVAREEQDMSGQKSSTKKSDKGVKAKTLSVSGLIPFREKQWLSDLFNLAESVDSKGEQKKYRVTNISAEAVNMREVQFSGEISAVEQNVQGWNVSFTLREVNSVAEKKEQRQKKPQAKVQSEKAPVATQQNSSTSSQAQPEAKPSPKDDSFWGRMNEAIGE